MSAPIEAAAEDGLDDQVVGGPCGADAYANVDLPKGRDVEIRDDEDLLLLVVHRRNIADGAVVCVPLNAPADDPGEVVADLGARREAKALIDVRAMQGTLERRIDREIPASDAFVDDGAYLPSPGVGRE